MGAVKEQSANLYAQKLAEQGFVTLSIDLSFWGESEGRPRNAVLPDVYAEDFSAVGCCAAVMTSHVWSIAEKIGYPPRTLSTKQAPAGYAPLIGDIAYYSPWGNVAIFYKDAEYAEGLIKMGSINGALEKLAGIKDGFQSTAATPNSGCDRQGGSPT